MPRTFTRCDQCDSTNHSTAECTLEDHICFVCWGSGHDSRSCYLNKTCGKCGQRGHPSRLCTERESRRCKNCFKSGHEHWECTEPKAYSEMRCERCDRPGHVALDCPTLKRPSEKQTKPPPSAKRSKRARRKKTCTLCWEKGHMRWQCPGIPCPNCGGSGHEFKACPPQKTEARRPTASTSRCVLCGSHEHSSGSCFIFQDKNSGRGDSMHSSEEPPFAFYEAGPSSTPKRKPDERTRAEQVKRDKPEQLWFSANEAFAEERYDDALALLTEAIALAPGNASYYVTRAATHMELCHFAAALRDFEVASTKTTYEPSTINHLRIARCRLILGSPSSALLALRDALSLDASNADALQMRRRVTELEGHMDAYKKAMARKHWRSARNEYESCLSVYAQQDSDAPEYVQCWGVELLIAEGKWDEATKSVDVLLHNTPNDIEVMTLRALVLFLKAESSAALTQVVTVLKLDPDNQKAKALWNRVKDVARQTESGEKALRQSDYETVINSWTNALLVAGEREEEGRGGILRAVLLLNRAEALCKLGKSSEGLKDVQESLKLHPTYSKAFLCRARIMIGLELFETAAVDFRASLEHGEATLSAEERCDIEAELEDAVRQAEEKESTQQDHYAVLGLTSSCTASEIKKAYRMLSLKHHPDKGGIEEKFKQLSSAYEILSDEEKKQAYDATLHRSYRQSWWWAQYNDDSHDYKTNYNYNEA